MYFVYVLENKLDKSWYTGFTENLESRIAHHNQKLGGDYTKKMAGKWELIYYEAYMDKKDALGREGFLKSGAGRRFLKKQLRNYLGEVA